MQKRAVFKLLLSVCVLVLAIFAFLHAGSYLVIEHPEKSDAIVALGGDHDDLRYWRGLQLLRNGYGSHMLLDVPEQRLYGKTLAQYATDFVAQSAGAQQSQIVICSVTNDSTVQETTDIQRCLAGINPAPRSILIVTGDFHTRRALSILRARLPQYHWSVTAVRDPYMFGEAWWKHREWAKICVWEWEKFLWWKLFESWHAPGS